MDRLTLDERDELLRLSWLNQQEFARLCEVAEQTMSKQLSRGLYKDLYITIGASRKFDSRKVKSFLGLTA